MTSSELVSYQAAVTNLMKMSLILTETTSGTMLKKFSSSPVLSRPRLITDFRFFYFSHEVISTDHKVRAARRSSGGLRAGRADQIRASTSEQEEPLPL